MRQESINTADATTAPLNPSSLPVPLEPLIKRQPSYMPDSRGRTRKKTLALAGLACLESVDFISVELDRNRTSCRFDKNYIIRDVTGNKIIFKGVQDFNPFNGLKNVLVRDNENLPVARVSFKQKSSLYSSMALAVYAPFDVLVGTGEEISGLFMFTSKLLIRNSDGDELFHVEYSNKVLSSSYQIKSASSEDSSNDEPIANIVEKTRNRIRLQIMSKMNIHSKVILIGFCIALVNKFTPPNKPPE